MLASRIKPLSWLGAEVVETVEETPRVRTIQLDVPGWSGHRPGQHLDVRLTAEDGYQAQRSYSIASAPEDEGLALTVELVEDGEVSGYLVEELRAGDAFEVRGPIGGYFVWEAEDGGPVLLVAGGSGVVPFRSMLRHRAAAGSDAAATLVVSARTSEDLIYGAELAELAASDRVRLVRTLTRGVPAGWEGETGRVSRELLALHVEPETTAFVCGPTGFVETTADLLVGLGLDPARVKTNDSVPQEAEMELDGNAVGGVLGAVFAFEVTEVRGRCDACGAVAVLAEARVYARAPGSVVRCSACEAELVVIVEAEGRIRLGLRGLTWLEVGP